MVSQQSAGAVADRRTRTRRLTVIERGKSAGKQFPIEPSGFRTSAGGTPTAASFPTLIWIPTIRKQKFRAVTRGFRVDDGQYVIEDLGSTNGTFVNRGRRLKPGERQPLNDGDEIIVGKTFLRFQLAK